MPEIQLPVAFAEFYNCDKKRRKKLQKIVAERVQQCVRNVSQDTGETCPAILLWTRSRTRCGTCPTCPDLSKNMSETRSNMFSLLNMLHEHVRQRVQDLSPNLSATCPETCPAYWLLFLVFATFFTVWWRYPSQTLCAKVSTFKIQILFANAIFASFFPNTNFENGGSKMSLTLQTG